MISISSPFGWYKNMSVMTRVLVSVMVLVLGVLLLQVSPMTKSSFRGSVLPSNLLPCGETDAPMCEGTCTDPRSACMEWIPEVIYGNDPGFGPCVCADSTGTCSSGTFYSHGDCDGNCVVVPQKYPNCPGGYTNLEECNNSYKSACGTAATQTSPSSPSLYYCCDQTLDAPAAIHGCGYPQSSCGTSQVSFLNQQACEQAAFSQHCFSSTSSSASSVYCCMTGDNEQFFCEENQACPENAPSFPTSEQCGEATRNRCQSSSSAMMYCCKPASGENGPTCYQSNACENGLGVFITSDMCEEARYNNCSDSSQSSSMKYCCDPDSPIPTLGCSMPQSSCSSGVMFDSSNECYSAALNVHTCSSSSSEPPVSDEQYCCQRRDQQDSAGPGYFCYPSSVCPENISTEFTTKDACTTALTNGCQPPNVFCCSTDGTGPECKEMNPNDCTGNQFSTASECSLAQKNACRMPRCGKTGLGVCEGSCDPVNGQPAVCSLTMNPATNELSCDCIITPCGEQLSDDGKYGICGGVCGKGKRCSMNQCVASGAATCECVDE